MGLARIFVVVSERSSSFVWAMAMASLLVGSALPTPNPV